jgi:DHA2 family multidrug resistance protein
MGVALLATLLDRRQAFHYEALSEHLSASDPAVTQRVEAMTHAMTTSGIDVVQAHDRAIALLSASMRVQASVLSFNDTFFVTSLVVVFALPLVFLLGKPQGAPKMAPGGH